MPQRRFANVGQIHPRTSRDESCSSVNSADPGMTPASVPKLFPIAVLDGKAILSVMMRGKLARRPVCPLRVFLGAVYNKDVAHG